MSNSVITQSWQCTMYNDVCGNGGGTMQVQYSTHNNTTPTPYFPGKYRTGWWWDIIVGNMIRFQTREGSSVRTAVHMPRDIESNRIESYPSSEIGCRFCSNTMNHVCVQVKVLPPSIPGRWKIIFARIIPSFDQMANSRMFNMIHTILLPAWLYLTWLDLTIGLRMISCWEISSHE